MDTDPGLICFQHCGSKVFCFDLPPECPTCNKYLTNERFQIPPFRVPYPFVRASQHPCSIVIRPTVGDFLNDYLNSMDLHIGITNSDGDVVEFDKDGLRQQGSDMWEQCLSVPGVSGPWTEHWDATLQDLIKEGHWIASRYDERHLNCYAFVLAFLQKVQCGELSEAAVSRTTFCERFIVPRTTAAGKYISLYRKLKHSNSYVHPTVWDWI
ncbi:hypothetical protein R5R35_013506 [Gryllus longicercus]|uniref:MKRN2 opposite strand protein n=1 Tax=Gryllus longicercus TaxID=2509291 RepID=A0AAN9V6B4_9ORTH|nr:Uncharacterized protein GBIM_16553 [Gryllus bimaculatus]